MFDRRGFSLVELLMLLGIVAVLIGLVLPTLSSSRRSVLSNLCAQQMRDNTLMIQLYASDHNDSWPFPFRRATQGDMPGAGWIVPGDIALRDDEYLGVRSFWASAMREDYGGTGLHPSLVCPADRYTAQQVEAFAEQSGVEPSRVVFTHDRIISAAMYVRPSWCSEDRARWEMSAATVGTLAAVRFPSSKAGLFESVPHHDARTAREHSYSVELPYPLMVAAVDGSVSLRRTDEAHPAMLMGEPPDEITAALWRQSASFDLTRDGWLGRDW